MRVTLKPFGEEGAVARVRLLLRAHAADREDHLVGLAREQVAPARAAVHEQADARRMLALDLLAVGGPRARDRLPGGLVDPAEGGDVLVRPEQDARLARAGLRRESGSHSTRRWEPSASQDAIVGAFRRASRGAGRAERARRSRGTGSPARPWRSVAVAPRDPLDDADRVGVVVVRAEDNVQHDPDRGGDEGSEKRPPEAAHLERRRVDSDTAFSISASARARARSRAAP